MSSTTNSGPNANTGTSNPNRGTKGNRNRHENKKKKELFTGNVEGFGDHALTMKDERPRGMGANYSSFYYSLLDYIGRSVSKGTARTWAKIYIMSMSSTWKPTRPKEPKRPSDESDDELMEEFEEAYDEYESNLKDYKEFIGGKWQSARLELWSTILGQCSPMLKDALRQSVNYKNAESTNNSIWLLQQANVLRGGGQITGFSPWQRAQALKDLLQYTQSRNMTLDTNTNEFKAKVKIFGTLGGSLTNKVDEWTRADGSTVKTNQALIVCLYLANANKHRYGDCIESLINDSTSNYVRYPTSIAEAYTMLDKFVAAPRGNNNNNNNRSIESYIDIDRSRPENEICLSSTKYKNWLIDALWVLLDTASTVTNFATLYSSKGYDKQSINSLSEANNYALVNATIAENLIAENLKAFSPRQQETGIQKAHEVYAEVGRPSSDNFLHMETV